MSGGPDSDEFRRFIDLLMSGAPDGYEPWLFRCEKESKAPATEFGSWKDDSNCLTPDEAVEWMERGYNIGIAGMENDRLVNVDIDDDDETNPEDMKATLRARSRSRSGRHGWYFAQEGEDVPNIPTEAKGEVRAQGQYVLAPGSYVPTEPEEVPDGQEEYAGYYTLETEHEPASITVDELPDVFREQIRRSEQQRQLDDTAGDDDEDGELDFNGNSALFDVTAEDVAAKEGASTNPTDRWESAFHGSDTGENMSLSGKGRIQCWRHNVAHGGLQALVTLSDYPGGCEDVGKGHKKSNAGPSCIKGDDSAIWYAWKYAKEQGYIPDDDPVPYRAMKHLCRERGLCPVTEIPDGYDPEEGERLPGYAFDAVIETIRNHDGLNPGREKTGAIDSGGGTADAAPDGGTAAVSSDTDGPDAGPDEPGGGGSSGKDVPTWGEVAVAFDSEVNGSTTRGYGLAATILSEQHDFVAVRESSDIYHYRPDLGYYVRKGATFIDELVERNLPEHANASRAKNIRQKVRSRNFISVDEFKPPEGKVNVRNGVIDLEQWADEPDDALLPHSPEYYFTAQLNVEYDPDADDGGFLEGAIETAIPDPPERKKWLEYIGYCLEFSTTDQEKALYMVGFSGAGKTSLQECVEGLFGSQPTVTALTPHQIADTRFDTSALADAALNTANDINAGKIEDTGTLKRIISGETTKLERKHRDAHFGEPKAKHLWTANWLPLLVGQDDAVYRRFLLIEFPNAIPDEEQDTEYRKRLKSDPVVRQVLLNLALEGRARFRDKDGFTNDRSRTDTRRLWDKWRDSNKLFLHSQFELTGDSDDKVEKQAYWQAYSEFAGRLGLERKSNRAVTRSFEHVPEIGGTSGESDYYEGLDWKEKDAADVSQRSRKAKVRGWIEEFETPAEGASVEEVIEHAEKNGVDAEKAESDIRNMLKIGELSEPETGRVRLT